MRKILLVEDNHVTREVLRARLAGRGYEVVEAGNGREALEALREREVDLVLLDVIMPEVDGLETLRELRREYPANALPVVVLTVKEGSDDVVEALRLGANDYVTKSVDFPVIEARIETQFSLRRLMAKVEDLAVRDPLTGLYNRRGFYDLAEREEARARRYDEPLQALLIDLDHFKEINDTHGHKIGDHALVETARRLEGGLRTCDLLGRWGGEEFSALLPGVELEGAERTAGRLLERISEHPIDSPAGPLSLTVSIGVAPFDDSCADLGELMAHVDQALYQAKRAGRGRVCVWAEAGGA